MVMTATKTPAAAIRGQVLTFTGNPFEQGLEHTMVYESDGIVAFADGVITHFGAAQAIQPQLPSGLPIRNYGPDSLISAGFLDSYVHYPQTPMIGAFW
jgi:guanine deaminase